VKLSSSGAPKTKMAASLNAGWRSGHSTIARSPDSLRIKQLEEELGAQRSALICSFNQLLDLKDLGTGIHSTRLAEWGMRVAQELNLGDRVLRDIEIAALLHDIGKIGVPDAILNKPGRLTQEEYALMKKHPEYGWAVLRLFPGFEQVSLFILHHHESYDGSGYPAGMAAEEIPMGSRIVSVIDAFDAMVSNRPYRQGLPVEEVVRRLQKDSGTQFDADVVRCFLGIALHEMHNVFAAVGAPSTAVF
jgi:HD-GYP domain-containing protein (c-di-GMP phosphodiesterase class II)